MEDTTSSRRNALSLDRPELGAESGNLASIVAGILLEVFLELWPLNRTIEWYGNNLSHPHPLSKRS
jgi:hypothetical protein